MAISATPAQRGESIAEDVERILSQGARKRRRRMLDYVAAKKFDTTAMQGGHRTGDVFLDWLLATGAAVPRTRHQAEPVKLMHGNCNRPDAEQLEDEMQAWGEARLQRQGGGDL